MYVCLFVVSNKRSDIRQLMYKSSYKSIYISLGQTLAGMEVIVMRENKKKLNKSFRKKRGKKKTSTKVARKNNTFKAVFLRYFDFFTRRFLKNTIIALVIFVVFILISWLDFFWNPRMAEYLYKISSEGLDLEILNPGFEKVINLFE